MRAVPAGGFSRRTLVSLLLTALVSAALVVLLAARLIAANQAAGSTPTAPVVGKAAPDFTVHLWNGTPGGQQVRLADLRGKPVVVNFWASWCVPCKAEAPILQAAWQKYQAQGVVLVGLAFRDSEADGTAFLQKYGITYPSGPDVTGATSVAFGVTGVPETFFIDRQGVIVQKVGGAIDDGTLRRGIERIVAAPAP